MFYRASAWSVGERLAELIAERRRELPELPEDVVRTHARRVGRGLAGSVGVALGIFMFLSTIDDELRKAGVPPIVMLAAWPSMLGAYALGRWLGPVMLRHRLKRALRVRRGSPDHQLAELEELGSTAGVARRLTVAEEQSSIALPMMALSLLAPLTLHLPVYALMNIHGTFDNLAHDLAGYSVWIALSGVIVGHAHLFLMGACARFAQKLRDRPPEHYRLHGWEIYGLTVSVSAMPGIVLFALPPGITALTGVCFVPAMFWWALRTVRRERAVLTP